MRLLLKVLAGGRAKRARERDVASRSVYVLAVGWCVWKSLSSPEIQGVVRAAGGVCAPGKLVSSLSCFFLVSDTSPTYL